MYSTAWNPDPCGLAFLGHIFVSHVQLQVGGFFVLVTAAVWVLAVIAARESVESATSHGLACPAISQAHWRGRQGCR